jgi:hypothetical protein
MISSDHGILVISYRQSDFDLYGLCNQPLLNCPIRGCLAVTGGKRTVVFHKYLTSDTSGP